MSGRHASPNFSSAPSLASPHWFMVMASARNGYAKNKAKLALERARARRNALRSGLYAKTTLLPFEDAKAYVRLRTAIFFEFGPQGAIEEGFVDLIIADLWRLNRFVQIENAFVEQTRLALTYCTADSLAKDSLELIQRGRDEAGSEFRAGVARQASQGKSAEGGAEIDGTATLLEAFICRISRSPMEDLARLRDSASRQLLRNIAALEALQARRQEFDAIPFAGRRNRGGAVAID